MATAAGIRYIDTPLRKNLVFATFFLIAAGPGLAAQLPGSPGSAMCQLAGQAAAPDLGPLAPLPAVLPASEQLVEDAALAQVKQILSYGGAIPFESKPFMELWFPQLYAKGLIGRKPTDFERTTIDGWFPKLADKNDWMITAESCQNYNCISWSVGITGDWSWPGDHSPDFDKFYLSYGYVPLPAGVGPEFADVAYWELPDGSSTHGCRHVAGEFWESKLGSAPRIIHRLNDLEGPDYGHVAKFYRKATAPELAALGVTPKTPDGDGKDPCAGAPGPLTLTPGGAYDIGSPSSKVRR
jgi:hypothetical protein